MGVKKDKFTKRAFSEGYFARSVYKLKDIQRKFKIIKSGDLVLDLGAAPGSWSQFAEELGAEVDAVDLNKVRYGNFIKADIMNDSLFERLRDEYDVVLSDLAPKTTGILKLDNERSYELSLRALEISEKRLRRGGHFVCKIFQSEFFNDFLKEVKKIFRIVKVVKPMASKKRSKEIYIVALRKK